MIKVSTEPFWRELRPHLLYALQPAALIVIGVLSVAHLVGYVPYVGIVVDLLVWVALYRYAFDCLRSTADGSMRAPAARFVIDDSLGWAQIWLQTIFLAANLIAFLALGPLGGIPVAIVLALALPGAIMTLAMDESLVQALNPVTWFAIFSRIGVPYVAVAGLQLVFNIAARYAKDLAIPFLPAFVAIVVFYFIAHVIVIVTFHLMGYLIWQHHEAIGYEPEPMRALRRANGDPDQEMLDEVEELVRDGDPNVAREMVANHLRGNGGSDALHTRYRKLLAVAGQRDAQLEHGREWIGTLLAQDKDRRAVDIARECMALDPAFELAHPDQVARVAKQAAEAGSTEVAVKLVSGFHRRYPKHRDIPRNYLLAARLLAERMGKIAEARALLDQLRKTYPDHPLAPDIAKYRGFIDTIDRNPSRAAS
jgi:hypothetical protein